MTTFQTLAITIVYLRQDITSHPYNKKDDIETLKSFSELSLFVFSNFPIPETHVEYINNEIGLNNSTLELDIIDYCKLIPNTNEDIYFDLDRPLRALEVMFSFGSDSLIDPEIKLKLDYLISKLHYLALRKKYELAKV